MSHGSQFYLTRFGTPIERRHIFRSPYELTARTNCAILPGLLVSLDNTNSHIRYKYGRRNSRTYPMDFCGKSPCTLSSIERHENASVVVVFARIRSSAALCVCHMSSNHQIHFAM